MNGSAKAPAHLWIVAILATLWNAFGALDYVLTEIDYEPYMASFTPECRAYFASYPAWMVAAWAIGVWTGLAGSLLLLARSRHAVSAFILSLAGLAVSTLYIYVLAMAPAPMRSPSMVAIYVAFWAVAIGLLIYARKTRAQGVLR